MGGALLRNTWLSPRPSLLYLKPTARCDLRCRICKRWQEPSTAAEEMSTREVEALLARFRSLGAAVLVVWGGEPLLRGDLGEIFASAKRLGYRTSLCTNASLLHSRCASVVPWLDTLLCSLDGYGATHDRCRGTDGLFERVLKGVRAARRHEHVRIKLWASVHRESLGELEALARLARDEGVYVEYFPISRVPGHNDGLVLEPEEQAEAFGRVMALREAGYPVWNSETVLRKMRDGAAVSCNFGRLALQVDHRGQVHSCEEPDGTPMNAWGRWDEVDWQELYASARFRRAAQELSRCGKCRLPCVVELGDELLAAYASMFVQSLALRGRQR
jgi:MoaA/NifB/PqqE/SkfB family radical SAM enzyme